MTSNQGNSTVIALVVLAVILVVGFVLYEQGVIGNKDKNETKIEVTLPGNNN